MRTLFILCFGVILPALVVGQNLGVGDDFEVVRAEVVDGDTLLVANLPGFQVLDSKRYTTDEEKYAYYRLKKNVRKVLPYAQMAAEKSKNYHDTVDTYQRRRGQRKYVKQKEDELKAEFEEELKKLTVTQGKILMKLIARETGESSYELVKDLRGGLSAFSYQTMARLFGHNMKVEYDPEGEDAMLELVVQEVISENESQAQRQKQKKAN